MTCKFCVNAEKPKYLASSTTSIYEMQDTQWQGGRRERSQRETELESEQLVEWQNEETNQLAVQGEKQRETEWKREGEREGGVHGVRGCTEIEWKPAGC